MSGILDGCNGVGHGMSYLGVLCKQPGGGKGGNEGRNGLLKNEKRAGGRHYRGKEKPRRVEPTGLGDWLGLVTGESR
jgi:hypothetical protein